MIEGKINKQYRKLGEKPVLAHTIKPFEENPYIDEIIIAVKEEDITYCKECIVLAYGYKKVRHILSGGAERQDSIYKALNHVKAQCDMVVIHDGARPFIEQEQINELIPAIDLHGAAAIGVPLKDTVKVIESDEIQYTPDRNKLRAIQTPQGFKKELIISAYEKAYEEGFYGTDDTVLLERMGIRTKVIEGTYSNIKITTEEDMMIANAFIRGEKEQMRVGIGFDVHRLVEGRKLILGGIEIPHTTGLLGHSDADVLIHAIMDALLGACGLGDIGKHFPDTDEKYKGISSLILLNEVMGLIENEGFQIKNIDSVIMAQKPKLAPYLDSMRSKIAEVLKLDMSHISIKATTTEGLGFAGREEGIAVQAIAIVES